MTFVLNRVDLMLIYNVMHNFITYDVNTLASKHFSRVVNIHIDYKNYVLYGTKLKLRA